MRLSLRARQVVTVTTLVACSMVTLASVNLASLVRHSLEESRDCGQLLARTIFHRARLVVPSVSDPDAALRDDPGIRAILESSIAYTESVTYATVIDPDGMAIAHSSPPLQGQPHLTGVSLRSLLDQGVFGQLAGIYRDTTLEIDEPILLGDRPFGSIRVGLSTVLIRSELQRALRPAVTALVVTLTLGLIVALVLARWALKPIHVIRAGLSQLERGDPDIHLELVLDPDRTGQRLLEPLDDRRDGVRVRDPWQEDGEPVASYSPQLHSDVGDSPREHIAQAQTLGKSLRYLTEYEVTATVTEGRINVLEASDRGRGR